ncbi:RNA polymerase II-associated protein 3 [Modicella reniformis]|uniref:RNA polymerase II-associated protein 3 n=1 Tax=Modicella reniformis TaxID=1440133 RepID=A0A9P6J106_9FUNG|nr:RNA polymerase II-associated protein 3 [Modicella reniformis]
METIALQRIAQWEQAHHRGNKKPLTTREHPPIRSKKDIVLKIIESTPLESKESRIKKLPSEQKGTNNEPSSRKGHYKSWDKFDVDQVLKDMDMENQGDSEKPHKKTDAKTGKTEKESTAKPAAVNPIAANVEKEKANELFKKGQYEKAIEHYSASITLDPSNSVLPINRAMALLKLGRFTEAETDCTLGLKLDNKNVKALWRRGIARRSLKKLEDAKKDFEAALKIEPNNKAVKEELTKLHSSEQATSPTKPITPSNPTVKQTAVTSGVKKQEVVKSVPLSTSTTTTTTTPTPTHLSTTSSKRVLIKEVENDGESELFKSTTSALPSTVAVAATATAKVAVAMEAPPSTPQAFNNLPERIDLTAVASPSPLASQPLVVPGVPASSQAKDSKLDIQMSVPTTNMEFQRHWRSFSKDGSLLYQYIKLIPSESLSSLFRSSFESDYLSSMLAVFREYYVPSETSELLYRTLSNLAKVQRFEMTLMFMSGSDKKDLVSIFQHLSSHLSDQAVYNQQELAALASKFKTTNY